MLIKMENLKKQIIIQAGIIETMFEYFIENLISKDEKKLKKIFKLEKKVNTKENEIEEEAIAMIALNQPEGKNLRTVVMIMKMNTDLERIGDLIADMGLYYIFYLSDKPFIKNERLILMGNRSQEMLTKSIESFKKEDSELAISVCESDDFVDKLNDELREDIIENVKNNPQEIQKMFDYYNIILKIERIADLATNIAEEAIYLSAGKDIKHGQFNV